MALRTVVKRIGGWILAGTRSLSYLNLVQEVLMGFSMKNASAVDRRSLLRFGGIVAVSALLPACSSGGSTTAHETEEPETDHSPMTAEKALTRLRYGNGRFAAGNAIHPDQGSKRRAELTAGQHPIATILSCVDSRVPPELIFDEGLGNLFVIRTAGQVVDHAVMGSIQFGVEELHIPLIVVLGHSNCGAVKATIEAIQKNSAPTGSDIDALVTAIKPAVEKARASKPEDLVAASVKANIEAVRGNLSKADLIGKEIQERKVTLVGAQYNLATGKVEFYE
jgi:carbonic anhydrase